MLGHQVIRHIVGQQGERRIDLVGGEQVEHVARRALAQADLDAGMRFAEARQQVGYVEVAGRQQRADGDAAPDQAAQLLDLAVDVADLRQDAPRACRDRIACLGRHDAAAGALEQLHAQLDLELPDLLRQRRLGDVKLLRRAREVPVAGDGLGVAELAQLHRRLILDHDRLLHNNLLHR